MVDLKVNNNYYITEDFRVFRKEYVTIRKNGVKLTVKAQEAPIYEHSTGHLIVRINRRIKYLHRLIYEAFIGDIPEGYEVHHKDGNKKNNSLDNLVCISCSEHMRHHMKDSFKTGKLKGNLVTEEAIEEMKTLRAQGMSYLAIAKQLGYGYGTVHKYLN